jgi:hypothetical protein
VNARQTNPSPGNEDAASVVLLVDGLPPSVIEDAERACTELGAPCVRVDRPSSELNIVRPRIVIAALARGQRRLSDEFRTFASSLGPTCRLLHVTLEPLVTPTTSLDGGRIVVLNPSPRGGRLRHQLQAMLRGDSEEARSDDATATGGVTTRVHATKRTWAAALATGFEAVPRILEDRTTPLIALANGRPLASRDGRLGPVERALGMDDPGDRCASELQLLLGVRGATFALSRDLRTWSIWGGESHARVWLASAVRVPHIYSFELGIARGLRRLAATSGDLLIVAVPQASVGEDGVPSSAVSWDPRGDMFLSAMERGGAAVLDLLVRWARDGRLMGTALVVEVT